MIAIPAMRPAVVFGTMSPYPTVVSVTIPHQNASPIVAKPGFVACSAWYAASEPTTTTIPATAATFPSLAARRRSPEVAISTRATRPSRASIRIAAPPLIPGIR